MQIRDARFLVRQIALTLAGLCVAAAISTAKAETFSLTAYLSGASAVPSNQGTAFGEADFIYDSETGRLDYVVTYEGLPSAQAEIHGPADTEQNAPVLIPFPTPESPIGGAVTLSSRQADLLLAGELYVDVHGRGYAGGEIRGQIEKRN
jgi:CHRD domain